MPNVVLLPVVWEIDEIPEACAKLAEMTGHDFEAEILAATFSGELSADGCMGLLKGSGGNLKHARALGREACVDWDDIAKWLRAKGYDVRRGRWIEFCEALEQLQARIVPAPTAAELETWAGFSDLKGYVDANAERRYLFENFFDWRNTELPERRLHLCLDSAEVAAFMPPCRWVTMPQLCERWRVTEAQAKARIQRFGERTEVNSWPSLFDDTSLSFEFVITLECVEAIEVENPGWLKFDAFAPERQIFPWLDLREREAYDAQRRRELMQSDAPGELARLRGAAVIAPERFSCWLEPGQVAALYGDGLVAALVEGAAFASLLPARGICTGIAVFVDDFVRWAGRPPIPEGAAGDPVRAWLSLATSQSEECQAEQQITVNSVEADVSGLVENVVATVCVVTQNIKLVRAKLQSFKDAKKPSPRVVAQFEAMVDACEFLNADPFYLKDGEKGKIEQRVLDKNHSLFDKQTSFRVAYEKAVEQGILCHWRRDQAGGRHVESDGKGDVLDLRNKQQW